MWHDGFAFLERLTRIGREAAFVERKTVGKVWGS